MSNDTRTIDLVINNLTEEQFENVFSPDPNELWVTPDDTPEQLAQKVDKTTEANKTYGTDAQGNQITYSTPTIPTVNNPTITITQGGVTKGSFTLNQATGDTIALDAGGGGIGNIDNLTITANANQEIQTVATINANTATGATNPIYDWVGTLEEYNNGVPVYCWVNDFLRVYTTTETPTTSDICFFNIPSVRFTITAVGTNTITSGSYTYTRDSTQDTYWAIEDVHPDWVCFITDDESGGASVYTKSEVDNLFATLYPVGSIYIGTQSTCPLTTIIPDSTWTIVSTNLVTGVNTTAQVAGNGMSLGLTNGTTNIGINGDINGYLQNSPQAFDKTISITQQTGQVQRGILGITTDATKSGITATITRNNLTVNVWQRTA